MAGEIRVRNLAKVQRAFRQADRDVRLGFRNSLRDAVQPVKEDAERLASSEIRNIGLPWSRMRIGITLTSVYVAPAQRGSRRGSRKRPNLADRLRRDAMEPALERNVRNVEREVDDMLGTVAARFNR